MSRKLNMDYIVLEPISSASASETSYAVDLDTT